MKRTIKINYRINYFRRAILLSLIAVIALTWVTCNIFGIRHFSEGLEYLEDSPTCVVEETLNIGGSTNSYAIISIPKNANAYRVYRDMTCEEFNAEQKSRLPKTVSGEIFLLVSTILVMLEIVLIIVCIGYFGLWLLCIISDKIVDWINKGESRRTGR